MGIEARGGGPSLAVGRVASVRVGGGVSGRLNSSESSIGGAFGSPISSIKTPGSLAEAKFQSVKSINILPVKLGNFSEGKIGMPYRPNPGINRPGVSPVDAFRSVRPIGELPRLPGKIYGENRFNPIQARGRDRLAPNIGRQNFSENQTAARPARLIRIIQEASLNEARVVFPKVGTAGKVEPVAVKQAKSREMIVNLQKARAMQALEPLVKLGVLPQAKAVALVENATKTTSAPKADSKSEVMTVTQTQSAQAEKTQVKTRKLRRKTKITPEQDEKRKKIEFQHDEKANSLRRREIFRAFVEARKELGLEDLASVKGSLVAQKARLYGQEYQSNLLVQLGLQNRLDYTQPGLSQAIEVKEDLNEADIDPLIKANTAVEKVDGTKTAESAKPGEVRKVLAPDRELGVFEYYDQEIVTVTEKPGKVTTSVVQPFEQAGADLPGVSEAEPVLKDPAAGENKTISFIQADILRPQRLVDRLRFESIFEGNRLSKAA